MKALQILEVGRARFAEQSNAIEQRPEPIIIFLTDGQPNIGVMDTHTIVTGVTAANVGNSSVFSLAMGDDADFPFLKKLSLRNSGFARKIYEASDTALQLTDFYRQVASPLLANVTFSYQPDQVSCALFITPNRRNGMFWRLADKEHYVALLLDVTSVSSMGTACDVFTRTQIFILYINT
jgi:hypothetical protein